MHVGIIMDGNGRWAKRKGFSRIEGHKKGALAVEEIIRSSYKLGVKTLTLYAFSTENWKRDELEVSGLMGLFVKYLKKHLKEFINNDVKINFLGRKEKLPEDVIALINNATSKTQCCRKLNLNIAIDYGGRDEIVRAVKRIGLEIEKGLLAPEDINEKTIELMLDTSSQTDPDLIIRTAGEQRLSNFLSWQSAYSEFYFSEIEWPEFNAVEFIKALDSYKSRIRSFGAVSGE